MNTTFNRGAINRIGNVWLRIQEIVPVTAFLVTVTSLGRYRRTLMLLGYRVYQLLKLSGPTMAVQYLKEASRLVIQWLSGNPEPVAKATGVLVRRDKYGLPTIIPHALRAAMLNWDVMVIKVVLTILGFYRVIRAPKLLKLHTITQPGSASQETIQAVSMEARVILGRYFPERRGELKFSFRWLFSTSAGPNGNHATWCAPLDAAAMLAFPRTLLAFLRLAPWYISVYMIALGLLTRVVALGRLSKKMIILGRLHTKEEAAGKVRVFAITDWWTQGLLYPIHVYLFALLRGIKQDGTMDQLAPLRRLLDWVRLGLPTYSYDLSAATDRLPVSLQREVLSFFCGADKAKAWSDLLVSRPWYFKDPDNKLPALPLKYAVGQPMGAYSSWAMLALTHHVLVQVAAARVGWTRWFPFYAVLGDDIVIADTAVAAAYHSLMVNLGVEINLSKSVISTSGFTEFAKRLMSPWHDFSPLGAKVLLAAYRSGTLLVSLYTDMKDKDFTLLPYQILESLGEILAFYSEGAKRSRALQGLLAVLGPSGSAALPIADWIAMRISPAGWGNWLNPGLAHAILWVMTSLNRTERDNANARCVSDYNVFWTDWPRLATRGFPSLLGIMGPGFWIYVGELYEILSRDVVRYSTRHIRDNTDWSSFTTVQMQELLEGAEFDWGLLAEAKDLRSEADRMARLRRKILSVQGSWSPDSQMPSVALTRLPNGNTEKDGTETHNCP
nr:MAG: putative RNA-dependent RNA polymerase [Mitoviridae sp.]